MARSAQKCGVYMLRLKTGKHFYIGATNRFNTRMHKHCDTPITKYGSSFPTKTYGFSGLEEDILAFWPCLTIKEAYQLETALIQKYLELCPDTAIFGGGVTFNTPKALHPEESYYYLTQCWPTLPVLLPHLQSPID